MYVKFATPVESPVESITLLFFERHFQNVFKKFVHLLSESDGTFLPVRLQFLQTLYMNMFHVKYFKWINYLFNCDYNKY